MDVLKSNAPLIVYLDVKSPYAFVAVRPTLALERELDIEHLEVIEACLQQAGVDATGMRAAVTPARSSVSHSAVVMTYLGSVRPVGACASCSTRALAHAGHSLCSRCTAATDAPP